MPSNHLILCHPLLLQPSIFPSIRVFSNESALCIRQPKYWSFSFNISPSNEHSGLISFRMDWLDLLAVQGTLKNILQCRSSKASILRHSALICSNYCPQIIIIHFDSNVKYTPFSPQKTKSTGFPDDTSSKEPTCQCKRHKRPGFDPWMGKIPKRRELQPTPVFLPGKSHGERSLTGYSPQSCKELDTTEVTQHACKFHTHTHTCTR